MGNKYAPRGVATKTSLARHNATFWIPVCFLLVLIVWNSSILSPVDEVSSGPVHDMVAAESEALSAYTTLQHKESINVQDGRNENEGLKSQAQMITAQYDNLMSLIPTHGAQEGLNGAESDITTGTDAWLLETGPKYHQNDRKIVSIRFDSGKEQRTENRITLPETKDAKTEELSSLNSRTKSYEQSSVDEDYSVITGNRSSQVNIALLTRYEEIRSASLAYSTKRIANRDDSSCQGKYVFVYDLPSEFNGDLVNRCDSMFPWFNLCDYFTDSGTGKPVNSRENGFQIFVPAHRWFNTHQYALELVSHARILKYKCRTEDPSLASLFYIPYYAGLDVIRWHFDTNATNANRDALGLRLVRWLEQQPSWTRRGGLDHVLVLGKISWDFRRQLDGGWGSRLLEFPEFQKVTTVLIERNPWTKNDVGVPHPTYFHPQSASDIDTWLQHVKSQARTSLVTFVGKERRNDPTNVRTALVEQCRKAASEEDCRFVECNKYNCLHPAFVTQAFMATHFCMQPVGDSPTRRSVFDSLIAGCIPVLFHPCTAYVQYPWHLPRNESSWSVYISEDEIRAGTANVVDVLKKISIAERDAMRETIINTVIPGLLYSAPGGDVSPYRDAFDITIDQLLFRAAHRPDLDQFD